MRNKETRLRGLREGAGLTPLTDLDANRVQRHLMTRRSAGKSARTVNQHRNTAAAFAQWCIDAKRLPSNPLTNLPRRRKGRIGGACGGR